MALLILFGLAPGFAQVQAAPTILTKHIVQSGSSPWLGDWNFFTYGYQLPVGSNLDGLTGTITISGTAANTFGETLVLAGVLPNCPVNGSDPIGGAAYYAKFPGSSVVFEWILKGEPNASMPASITFPVSVPVMGCFFVTLNSGDPQGGTFTTSIDLTLSYDTGPAPINPPFRGGEGAEILHGYNPPSCGALTNCVNTPNSTPSTYVYTGDMYNSSSTLLGLYGSVSAAAIQPGNGFNVVNTYYLNPSCTQSGNFQGPFVTFIIPANWISLGIASAATLSGGPGLSDSTISVNQNSGLSVPSGSCIEWVSNMNSGNAPTNIESRIYPWLTSSTTVTTTTTSSSSVIDPVPSPVTVTNLTPFIGSVKSASLAPKVGVVGRDLGTNTMRFTQSGIQFFRADGNLTIGLPTLGLANIPFATLKNSSLIEYSGSTVNEIVKNSSNPYDREIDFFGTVVGSTTVSIPLIGNGFQPSVCDSGPHFDSLANATVGPCTQIFFGSMGFGWNDVNLPFTFNNVTDVLSITVSGTFSIDPLALDNSGTCTHNGGGGTTCVVTFSPSNTNDVLYCTTLTQANLGTDPTPNMAVTDNKGNTWTRHIYQTWVRGLGPAKHSDEGWWTVWSGSGAITITVTSNIISADNVQRAVCFGISGANTVDPFDPHPSIPAATNSGVSAVTSQSVTISTTNANDFLVAMIDSIGNQAFGSAPNACQTPPTSFTYMTGGNVDQGVAYRIVSATQSGVTETWSWTPPGQCFSQPSALIFDAICAASTNCASVAQKITITTLPGGAPTATITLSGCNGYNSTFTANAVAKKYNFAHSCTVTLTEPADGANTRYRFNISPHPTASTTVTFVTCAVATITCTAYSNSTYYQLQNTYQATPLVPSTWDAIYAISATGTFLGVTSNSQGLPNTANGGGAVSAALWFDYNQAVSLPTQLGNTWFAVAPNSFTQTTGGNTNNVNYNQQSASNSGAQPINYFYLPMLGFALGGGGLIILANRNRRRS